VGRISVSVEAAKPDDAQEIAVLLQRSIRELCTADHGNNPDKLTPWLANKNAATVCKWIAAPGFFVSAIRRDETDRRVVGVAMGNETGDVLLNYIHPDVRFCGVSKVLMEAVERYFVDRGLCKARLTSTKTAERFYGAIGYVQTGNPGTQGSTAARTYEKVLQR